MSLKRKAETEADADKKQRVEDEGEETGILPLWVNKNQSVAPLSSHTQVKHRAQVRIRTLAFQTALLKNDRKAALGEEFSLEMDNSCSCLADHPNPIVLWAKMKAYPTPEPNVALAPNGAPAIVPQANVLIETVSGTIITEFESIFILLIRTGAQRFINLIDPITRLRPIDYASVGATTVLVHRSLEYKVDLDPSETEYPLYNCVVNGSEIEFLDDMLRALNPNHLDWVHPTRKNTTFYLTLHKATERSLGSAETLLTYVGLGLINPYHACFTANPLPATAGYRRSNDILHLARQMYDDYKSVHLPQQIALAAPSIVASLVELIRDYLF